MRLRASVNPAYLFLAPSAVVLVLFALWPIAQAFWMSLHQWSFLDPEKRFIGLGNYLRIASDDRFWNALGNTAMYTLGSVPIQIALALLLAVALNQRIRGLVVLRAAYFFPVVTSLAVMAIVWSFLMDPDIGLISTWIASLGGPRIQWLRDPFWAMPAVIIVGIWKTLGFNMVILLAGLQGIPQEQYEAASIDGAGRWGRFRHVTLPGLRHTLAFVTVISVIASLQVFDQVYVMTRGGPLFATETLVTYMYHQGFELFRMGYASSIAWILFLLIVVASVFQLRLFRYRDVD
jgi:multiple sugar transport system permease protein